MFLPVVLPPLFSALEAEVKFNIEAADADEEGEVSQALTVGFQLFVRFFQLFRHFKSKKLC